jgi:hypothetical protein
VQLVAKMDDLLDLLTSVFVGISSATKRLENEPAHDAAVDQNDHPVVEGNEWGQGKHIESLQD